MLAIANGSDAIKFSSMPFPINSGLFCLAAYILPFSFDDMAAIEKAPLSSLVAFIKASRVDSESVLFKWIK